MKTFFIISDIVLLALTITLVLYFLYGDIRHKIRRHKIYKKALQELDEQFKEIMDKLKKE